MDAATLAQWQAVTEQHALKPVGSAEEKIHLLRGLSRPADVPAPKGQPSVTALLERLPRGWRPDLFVWIDGGPDFLPLDLGRLDCPTVCLAGDTHAQLDWRLAYARPFSHVFLMFNRQHMAAFRDAGCPRVGWLPAACDPDIHRAFGAAKAWDVVFVGQTLRRWHPDRVRLLERLRAAGFDVHVTTKILEEMALAFSRGRIVFNRSLAGDLNMRVFEALASGSMLLTDRLPPESGLEDLFTDRAHLVCYDEDTLEPLARHYLDHPEEREAIARAGHEAVLARHTYGHRVRALLAAVLGTDAGGEMDHDRATERGRSAFGHPPEWAARGGGTAGTTGEARVQEAASGPGDRAGDEALPAYYRNERHEIAALVPAGARRVLDVGCAAGGLGRLLKSRARCEVVGIESHAGAAEAARHHLDQVLVMDLDAAESLPFEAGAFDCVVCADVLEHLRDPERALRLLRRYLAPEGTLVASIPNVRHASVLVPLLVAGRFEYQAEGILDRTHLRFFTLAEIVAMVERTGFRATGAAATKTPEDGAVGALAPVVAGLGGDAERFREESTIVQYLITAALAPEPGRPAAAAPRVTLVIPVHDRADLTARCLEALARTVDPSATEVIVVDNASTDAARDLLARAPLPVRVIENAENAGFGRASNQGARAARGDLLVFLNNDTEPEPGWLEALESAAAEPGVGIVGARLLYPATRRIQHAGLALNPDGIPDHVWRNAREDDPRAGAPRDLDMVTGACLAIRRERFRELGGFDEGYVNGVEDVDLCLTARRAGLRVRYEPRAVVLHNEGSTRGRFAHVAPNLRRLADKWGPTLASMPRLPWSEFGEEPGPTVAWEGSFFLHHSLAGVNRAVCRALLREGVDLTLTPFEVDEVEPRRLPGGPELARLVNRPVKRPPALRVRHRFPPDWEPRPGERLVVIQPWEFGAVPAAWVDAIRRGVEELWVPSEFVRRGFVSGGVPPERVVVIPNGFDPALFHPGVTPLPLPTARRARFLYVGGSIPRKGWDVLLRAYVEEFTADDDVCLIIKDHAYYGHRLDGVLADLRRDPRAPEILYFFESMTPGQLAGLYAAADWLVHPFRGEGFGLPVLEAMACGKPVIVTDAGPVREFCPEGAGLFIPATPVSFPEARIESLPTVGVPTLAEPDRAALRRALRAAYQDPAQARARGQAAAAHVHAHFTWERIGRRYALRIRALLAGGPRPADRTAPEAPAPRSILDGAPADALAALALPAP
jgi:GT2 family glycosyltransferase/2-polyprenyl-3-methyl-5-hydroxy-6-metoxy-1,4-benzoquinol methylase